MTETLHPRRWGLARILWIFTACALTFALVCLLLPGVRRKDALTLVGEQTVTELRAFTTALSYYAGDALTALSVEQKLVPAYKEVAGLLAQVRTKCEYRNLYLLVRTGVNQYQYLVDAAYRDNAKAGTDYYGPATAYPLDLYKPARAALDAIYTGKATSRYTTELVTLRDLEQVSCTWLPLYGTGGTVIAVLGVDRDPGNTGYHLLGPLDLNLAGLTALFLAVLCGVLAWLTGRFSAYRRTKQEAKAAVPVETPCVDVPSTETPPSSEPLDPASPYEVPDAAPHNDEGSQQ
ncbi:MAG: hypothetical protein RR320_03830 [Oscillospiraceae bacterium]